MKTKLFLALPLVFITFSFAHAEPALKGCAAKKHSIETQLDYARKYNNSYQINGLEKALKDVSENCTDEKLRAERKAKMSEKTRKVSEREAELNDAKAQGNRKKITKKMEKLEKAKQELKEAQDELNR
ncbi:DUF1090 domain-containing protein [Bartonella apihabitans]|uniref:DUF1090 domain-containing protein n=1 Tax=Bartonella apihabitans TaxID=2750929 RepID=UPI003998FDE1